MKDSPIADWDNYELPGFESRIIVGKGRIIEVHCADAVEYQGHELIGMDSSEVRELLGQESSREEGVGFGHALYYDGLGLTLFVVDDVVEAASCGPVLDEKDSQSQTNEMNGDAS